MTVFYYARHGVNYAQVWFNEEPDLASLQLSPCDIIEFKESYVKLPLLYPFTNGVIDLLSGADAAYERFDKGFKYEIRRAEKENVVCTAVTPDGEQLAGIFRRYVEFSKTKNSPILPFDFFDRYQKNGSLMVTAASFGDRIIQYHLYFRDPSEDILLASFPGEETAKKALAGFANRALHWFDIRLTRSAGRRRYNLGGMGNSGAEETQGIARFKREMAPEEIPYFQGSIPLTLKGKLYSKLRQLLRP